MANSEEMLKNFAIELFKINAIKFGEFQTKVGLMTPIYCDLRVLVSHPKLMGTLSELISEKLESIKNKVDLICGVPYTALPIATIVSYKTNIPMVMRRKEAKDYGTKKLVEGEFKIGDKCLIIEDVVTSGSSILETAHDLKCQGLKVRDAIVLLNREQGGEALLKENHVEMHALLTMTQLLQHLKDAECISDELFHKVKDYFAKNQIKPSLMKRTKMPLEQRLELIKNKTAQKLVNIMLEKKTVLCLAADLTKADEILTLAQEAGPFICMLKLHADIIEDFNDQFVISLKKLAKQHQFLLFEDRKFADIGKTNELQFTSGPFKISTWADVITVHSLTGNGFLEFLLDGSDRFNDCGVFLLAECSAKGSLIDDKYIKATLKAGIECRNVIAGFVCQSRLFDDEPGFLQLTPGVSVSAKGDAMGQQYNSPDVAVMENGADVAVVGRGITRAKNRAEAAENYKHILWTYYQSRVQP